jgi:hypothetical protein
VADVEPCRRSLFSSPSSARWKSACAQTERWRQEGRRARKPQAFRRPARDHAELSAERICAGGRVAQRVPCVAV